MDAAVVFTNHKTDSEYCFPINRFHHLPRVGETIEVLDVNGNITAIEGTVISVLWMVFGLKEYSVNIVVDPYDTY